MSESLGVIRPDGEHRSLRIERTYDIDIDGLWEAITTRERLARWFASVEGDLRLGGRYVIVFAENDPGQRAGGEILECDPPRHLLVSWRFESGDSRVRIDLEPDGEGTRLVLDHQHLPPGAAGGYGAGWHTYLEQLGAHLSGKDGHGPAWDERFGELKLRYDAQMM